MTAAVPTDPIVGIDLGTTNSLVAFCDERGPRVLLDSNGRGILPSVVRFPRGGAKGPAPIVGFEARDHLVEFPLETVASSKRFMGRGFAESRGAAEGLPAELVEGPHGLAAFRVGAQAPGGAAPARVVTPQEVAAIILARLKAVAEERLGVPIRRAVITVPAYFDDGQRQATRDAARLAGLQAERIVNEPTAAALAYGLGRKGGEECVAVYDLGGGTFDITILRISPGERGPTGEGAPELFEVLATAGDTRLGGDDIDQLIVTLALSELRRSSAGGFAISPASQQALRTFAEQAKIALSNADETHLELLLDGDRTIRRVLSRRELEAIAAPLLARTAAACRRALADAGRPKLDRVVLVGGSTRMPAVRRLVAEIFGQEPYTALDPEQVVALGAAVQASILAGGRRDLLLLDVIPLSLGIETVGGANAKLLMRNSAIPARATEMFSTSVDNQTAVKIHVVQGEREMVADCRSLGRFELKGIPPMPAAIPQIEVEFLIDANGILRVSATERRSAKQAGIQVVPSYGLTAEEVDRMERASVEHAREDMLRHRLVDLAVNSRLDMKLISEALARVRGKLPAEYAAELDRHLAEVGRFIAAAESNPGSIDPDAFHAAKEALDRTSVRLHEVAITESLKGRDAGS